MCPECLKVREACGGRAPVGYRPADVHTDPIRHLHVIEVNEKDSMRFVALCQVPNPRKQP